MALRLVFMGTPDFAVKSLSVLLQTEHEVVAVYTQPPRPAGRGMKLRKSPVHIFAETHQLPVFSPEKLNTEERQEELRALDADALIVAAYGLLLPASFFNIPHYGGFNLHASLLPRWRGAAPIHRAIMSGDQQTGVQIMEIAKGLDTGDIFLSDIVHIGERETVGSLQDRLSIIGAEMWPRFLAALERGQNIATPQSMEGICYAHKIEEKICRIDWSLSALEIDRKIRGLSPYPASWFQPGSGENSIRVKCFMSEVEMLEGRVGFAGEVLDNQLLIACGEGSLRLKKLQKQGKKSMDADSFLRGEPIKKGERVY